MEKKNKQFYCETYPWFVKLIEMLGMGHEDIDWFFKVPVGDGVETDIPIISVDQMPLIRSFRFQVKQMSELYEMFPKDRPATKSWTVPTLAILEQCSNLTPVISNEVKQLLQDLNGAKPSRFGEPIDQLANALMQEPTMLNEWLYLNGQPNFAGHTITVTKDIASAFVDAACYFLFQYREVVPGDGPWNVESKLFAAPMILELKVLLNSLTQIIVNLERMGYNPDQDKYSLLKGANIELASI